MTPFDLTGRTALVTGGSRGIGAAIVAIFAAHGAKVIFLPTWGAAADVERGGYIATLLGRLSPSFDAFAAERQVRLLDGAGRLTGATREAVEACAQLGLSLATGHAGLAESTAIAEYAAGIGFDRLLVTHPLHYVDEPGELPSITEGFDRMVATNSIQIPFAPS